MGFRIVKNCFGRYGDKDLEFYPPPKSKEKPRLNCNMLCEDFPKCRKCYFLWWKHHRPREKEIINFIREFMRVAKLEFRKHRNRKF